MKTAAICLSLIGAATAFAPASVKVRDVFLELYHHRFWLNCKRCSELQIDDVRLISTVEIVPFEAENK